MLRWRLRWLCRGEGREGREGEWYMYMYIHSRNVLWSNKTWFSKCMFLSIIGCVHCALEA